MRKILTILTAFSMMFGLTGCNGQNAADLSTSNTPDEGLSESSAVSENAPSSELGNTLVVYFSATGNTEEAANYIAEITGGDLFELEPVDPYTDEDLNYGNEDSRVSQEHANEELRHIDLVEDTVDNWEEYDTVFIGYPKMEQGYICV